MGGGGAAEAYKERGEGDSGGRWWAAERPRKTGGVEGLGKQGCDARGASLDGGAHALGFGGSARPDPHTTRPPPLLSALGVCLMRVCDCDANMGQVVVHLPHTKLSREEA